MSPNNHGSSRRSAESSDAKTEHPKSSLFALVERGQSYWMDDLTRDMLDNGNLAHRVSQQGLRGITSNPTIFDKAISGSNAYNRQIEAAARVGGTVDQIYEELVISDVQRACDVLLPVHDATGGVDGFVSIEVSPQLARDTDASIKE